MEGREGLMGLLALNFFVLWSIGGNQNLELELMVENPHILKCLFIVRYVHSTSFLFYGFGLLQLQSSPFDENYQSILWFTSFNFMALVVRLELNGRKTLLSHDDVMGQLP
jgi:hypothetical protein